MTLEEAKAVKVGDVIVLGQGGHEDAIGWAPTMQQFVGRVASVTRVFPDRPGQPCVHVDVDRGGHFWLLTQAESTKVDRDALRAELAELEAVSR